MTPPGHAGPTRNAAKLKRELEILRQVVEGHIETGAAVGSKWVAARMGGRLSPATVRAVMSALDERGWLVQPHTSSGRVPTDSGYRTYLDHALDPGRPRPGDRERVETLVWSDGQSLRDLLRGAAQLVASGMGLAALIAAPRLERQVLQRIEFVWLRAGTVLAIVVTRSGVVHERLLQVEPQLLRQDFVPLANYLNTILPGRSLAAVRELLHDEQRRDRAALGELEAQALALGARALAEAEGGEVVVDGTASVLELEEFSQPGRAADLVRALDRREVWLSILDETIAASDTKVYVGAEVGGSSLADCGLVATGYRAPAGAGVVALLGPRRLDYRRAIPLVELVATRLTALLERSSQPGR